jgi:hypothetical protein
MNASSQSRFRKGAILNTKHTAPSVARVFKAARLFRFLAVRGSLKVRSLAAKQSSSLFGFRFLSGNGAKPSLSNLFSRFWCAGVMTVKIGMALAVMLFGSKAFKIFCSVIGLAFVNVMNVLFGIKKFQPASRHNTMRKSFSAKHGVAIGPWSRCVRLELSENFSATRNSVQVVKKSIFDTVYLNANHVVPLGG